MKKLLFLPVILLAAPACQTRFVPVPCLTQEQLAERERAEPPKIADKLTGKADEDTRIIAGSAIRLRAWGRGNLEILRGCVSPSE